YDYMMNKFKFGGLDKPGIYLDQTVMRMCATHRRLFSQLALALLKEGKTDKAKKVLEKCEKEIPDYNVPMDYMSGGLDLLTAWGNLGDKKHATDIADKLWKQSEQFFIWYISSSPSYLASSKRDCDMHIYIMQGIAQEMDEIDRKWSDEHINKLNQLYGAYQTKLMSVN
ncbi:MAG: hypothetical protein J6Y23_01460, partial [Prevotella sp.]|nr:hypothetical protein [Prevotella sp.]